MRFSLSSVGKLDDEGYHSHLGEGKWKLTKGSLVLARRKKNNTLYNTKAKLVKGEVERQIGKQLKSVRAHTNGEYRGLFEQYCRSHDIKLEKTVPKTLQQNGVAERMNRTICDRISGPSLTTRLNNLDRVKKPKPFSEQQVDLGSVSPNSMEHNEHREVMQEEQVDTIDRNDKFAVDDVEENPTIENNGLEQQQEQATSELPTETQLRRSTRERQPSKWYTSDEYLLLFDGREPKNYQEVIAMHEVMKSLHKNNTYELMELSKGKRALKNKWVLKRKPEPNRSQPRYKTRLVVKGLSKKKDINFEEIFSPVEIYMEQLEGFTIKGKEHLVCRLKKNLYGLKKAPRQWYKKFDSFMVEYGYDRTVFYHCVFVKKFSDEEFIILLLYVDDMLIVGRDTGKIDKLKKELSKSFEMKDLGLANLILGTKISQDMMNGKL
ncbi:hypothetical protein AAG906_017451 [Vitis piasezkii]